MKYKSNPELGKVIVDHAFVSKEMKVLEKACPQVDVSDHLPLEMRLSIR